MRKSCFIISMWISISLFTGCVPSLRSDPPASPMDGPSATASFETGSITQQPCLNLLPALPRDKSYPGRLVLGEETAPFINLFTHDPPVIIPIHTSVLVSPDRKKYSVSDLENNQIEIYSAAGNLLNKIQPGNFRWFPDQWLDNDRLVLVIDETFPESSNRFDAISLPPDLIIINTSNNETQRISPNYPGIDQVNNWPWKGGDTTKYDSTLTRVIYRAAIINDFAGETGLGYILWDLDNNKKLIEIVNEKITYTPQWSPDGSKFAATGLDGDLLIVTREGVVLQRTHFLEDDSKSSEKKWYDAKNFSWSPNGQLLGFWLESGVQNTTRKAIFVIFDLSKKRFLNYCVPFGRFDSGSDILEFISGAVWSPDSQAVLIEVNIRTQNITSTFDTVLLDLSDGFAAKIAENSGIAGWLDTTE